MPVKPLAITPPSSHDKPKKRMMAIPLFAIPATAILPLAGCGIPDTFAPPCPDVALLRDGADLTRFRGTGQDLTDTVVAARITGAGGSCKKEGPNKVLTTMHVTMQITRGPALEGRTVEVPYFIAVTDNGRVLDEQDYVIRTSFPANVEQVRVDGDNIDLLFPVSADKSAAAYRVFVSFRLSPAQLDYNRKRIATQ
jgi:hypothetical protein